MKIGDFRKFSDNGKVGISARVDWEDCDRGSHTLSFQTDGRFGDQLLPNPHAFLLASVIPAMYFGERRVAVQEEICSELLEGIGKATSTLRNWFPLKNREVTIEAKTVSCRQIEKRNRRNGCFLSGGIDSFSVLRENYLRFPTGHPRRIMDGILVFGLEQDDPVRFEYVKEVLENTADKIGISLIPIYTDIYLHYRKEDEENGFWFWIYEFGGAALAAVAHALSPRFASVTIGGHCDPNHLGPWGSHPLLDPYFSSSDLLIRHEGVTLTRLDKTRLVAGWDVAVENLRVCNHYKRYSRGVLNCSQCEKCVRTMLEFYALDALDRTGAFPCTEITAQMIFKYVNIDNDFVEGFYLEILDLLTRKGRTDLVQAIEYKIKEYRGIGMKRRIKNCLKKAAKAVPVSFPRYLIHPKPRWAKKNTTRPQTNLQRPAQ